MDLSFDHLVQAVESAAPNAPALQKLATASSLSEALSDHADALLGHYVELCRKEGRSWSEIGGELRVSKQAAQKRFVDMPLGRVTPRTKNVLDAARQIAQDQGSAAVRLDHLTLAIYTEPKTIGAKILKDLGIRRSDLDEAIGKRSRSQGAQLHLDAPADQAVLASALDLGHNYVGTEHILIACHRDPHSLMATVLDGFKATQSEIRQRVDQALGQVR
jgi:ATP-dependent Clp protease ATP-binding subunit ClpA